MYGYSTFPPRKKGNKKVRDTFVGIFLRQALGHLPDDLPQLPGVLLDGKLLLRVEVGLHGLAQHDLGQHRAEAVRGGLGLCWD